MSQTAPASPMTRALASSRLGVFAVIFFLLSAAAPFTVVAGGATAAYAITALIVIPLGYLLAAGVLSVFSVGFVAMSRLIVNAGAFYTYVVHGINKAFGVAAAFVAVVGYNAMQVGLIGGFGYVLGNFVNDRTGFDQPWWAWALLGWAVIAWLGGRSVDINGKVLAVLVIAEIAVALVFASVQVAHPAGGQMSYAAFSPGNLTFAAIGVIFATAVAGFVGFEIAVVFGEETRDPVRTVPRAMRLALVIIGLLYGFCAWAMQVRTGPDKIVDRATTESSELIFNLSAPYLPALLITIGHMLFISSLFAAALSFHHTSARYFFVLGREGVLFKVLGRTSPKTKAPLVGSLTQSAIGLAGIAVYGFAGWNPFTQMFFWLTVLGGVGVLILMTVTSVAVAVFFARRRDAPATDDTDPIKASDEVGVGRGIVAPIGAALLLGGGLVATVQHFDALIGVAATDPARWWLPGSFAIAVVLGLLWAWFLKVRRPEVYEVIGRGVNRDATPALSTVGR